MSNGFSPALSMLVHDEFFWSFDHHHASPFHTNASASHLPADANVLVAYSLRMLIPAQLPYTTIENEFLSIVETLHEF
jgi:hypothetical protein